MRTLSSLFFAVVLFGLVGCDSLVQEVNPDRIPTATAKLVIHSYISPQDTVLAVVVELPSAVLGQQTGSSGIRQPLSSAVVNLSDGTSTVRLPFSLRDQLYRVAPAQLPILAGRTYTLTVSAPNYPTTTAQCTVPAPVRPTQIRVDSVRQNQGQGTSVQYSARLLWQDQAGAANYYTSSGFMLFDLTRQILVQANPRVVRDTTITERGQLFFEGNSAVTSDKSRDGQQFISGTFRDFNNYYEGPGASGVIRNLRISMLLTAMDENSYRYRVAAEQQIIAQDNPFAEPVLIPSNIQNGLGCFGAQNSSSITVKVR